MAQLLYGSPPTVFEIDSRTLAHIEMVVLAKLRRSESFSLTIDEADGARVTIWIGVHSDLQFAYSEPRGEINREWLERLMDSANSTSGLRALPESTGV
jgi:hypothetical protein